MVGPEGHSVRVPTLSPGEADGDGGGTEWPTDAPLPPPLKLLIITGSQARADQVATHARRTLAPDVCHIIAAEVHVVGRCKLTPVLKAPGSRSYN